MSPTTPNIQEWLANTSFEDLFLRAEEHADLDQPEARASLQQIAGSLDASPKLRVLAHELLIESGASADPSLVELYCLTLPDTFFHNAWGMPGGYVERLGKTLIGFGRDALPCLARFFRDKRSLGYFGSEEPTLSEAMKYRVSDLAAYLASLIAGVPYHDDPDPAKRDIQINRLLGELNITR